MILVVADVSKLSVRRSLHVDKVDLSARAEVLAQNRNNWPVTLRNWRFRTGTLLACLDVHVDDTCRDVCIPAHIINYIYQIESIWLACLWDTLIATSTNAIKSSLFILTVIGTLLV